jgi:lipoprotein-anchoring transpeptidase ErfK/SrfK
VFYGSTLQQLEELAENTSYEDRVIPVESVEMYKIIAEMGPDTLRGEEAMVSMKYKTIEKKVKPAAGPLPADSEQKRKEVSGDPTLRKAVDIGHTFTDETRGKLRIGGGGFLLPEEEERFREMLMQHGKAFAFTPKEIGCIDPKIVEPMVI